MRVSLDHKGLLTVTAETAIESYALDRWREEFGQPGAQAALAITVFPADKPLVTVETE